MHGLSQFLQFVLCIILVCVCTLSVQLAGLAWVRVFRKRPVLKLAELNGTELPHVLVQLPVCDEGPLAVRVAASAACSALLQRSPMLSTGGGSLPGRPRIKLKPCS